MTIKQYSRLKSSLTAARFTSGQKSGKKLKKKPARTLRRAKFDTAEELAGDLEG